VKIWERLIMRLHLIWLSALQPSDIMLDLPPQALREAHSKEIKDHSEKAMQRDMDTQEKNQLESVD